MNKLQLPYEIKTDKDGLFYIDSKEIRERLPLHLDTREPLYEKYYPHSFYKITSTRDYLIKYCITVFTRKEIKELKNMLDIMKMKRGYIKKTDFPIGYFKDGRRLSGLIVPSYIGGLSFDHILEDHDFEELKDYYLHDEDDLHNLFLVLEDVIDAVYEMFENNIYFSHFYSDDIMLYNNEVKMIDFNHHTVFFNDKDKRFESAIKCIMRILNEMLENFNLSEKVNENIQSFEEAKKFTKKIENKVRKG